jgi:hypothetical protein
MKLSLLIRSVHENSHNFKTLPTIGRQVTPSTSPRPVKATIIAGFELKENNS